MHYLYGLCQANVCNMILLKFFIFQHILFDAVRKLSWGILRALSYIYNVVLVIYVLVIYVYLDSLDKSIFSNSQHFGFTTWNLGNAL